MNDRLHALQRRITEITGRESSTKLKIFENTSEFIAIEPGDILRLAGRDYLVTGHAREGRFGIDEQPKFWVKKTIDLTSGERKIVKLVFLEKFKSRIGSIEFDCSRSPEKEAAVLSEMRGHPNFMQGKPVNDAVGNIVRIIDVIPGPSLYDYLRRLEMTHEFYYYNRLNQVMQSTLKAIAAIVDLHKLELNHGDIRADHLIVRNQADTFVWIDFDYDVKNRLYDLFCIGNVLLQVVGKGRHSLQDIRLRPAEYPDLKESFVVQDMSLMFQHRIANLRKLFPYIASDLNSILLRFSCGASDPYGNMKDLLSDLTSLFPTDLGLKPS